MRQIKSYSKPNEKMRCSLCGEYKLLCDSHILSEFVYGPVYDQSHIAVKIDINKNKLGKTQKGFSERMLCVECEGLFNKWEAYFARVWFHRDHRLRPYKIDENLIFIRGLDYKKFKLFHLSLIWRAGVSKRSEFDAVTLGPHAEKIRIMLLDENPGEPEDYQFTCLALRDPKTLGFCDSLIRAFEASKLYGHRVYSILFGGVMWAYWVSSHTLNRPVPPCFRKDGTLVIAVQDWDKNLSIQDLAKHVKKIGTI
jgi:hypothetical protein